MKRDGISYKLERANWARENKERKNKLEASLGRCFSATVEFVNPLSALEGKQRGIERVWAFNASEAKNKLLARLAQIGYLEINILELRGY